MTLARASLLAAALLTMFAVQSSPPAVAASPSQPACRVPNLIGKTVIQVEYDQLAEDYPGAANTNCLIGRIVTRQRTPRGRTTVIVAQRPRAGTVVPYDSPITLALGPAPRRDPRLCRAPPGSDVVARTPRLLVYARYTDTGDITYVPVTWLACLGRRGPKRTIYRGADGGSPGLANHFTVAGNVVAYAIDAFSKFGDGQRSVSVFDVASGRQAFVATVGTTQGILGGPPEPPLPEVLTLVVNASGSIAWLTRTPTGSAIDAHDSHGTRRLDQAGPGGLANLHLNGTVLSWTRNGAPQTTALT